MKSFFNSEYWRDVERTLQRAPFIQRGGTTRSSFDPNVALRLLQNRLDCIRRACNEADHSANKRLLAMFGDLSIEPILYGLLEVLKEAVLIVGGSVGVGAAIGAGIGAFFGGVGALPGGVIGAGVGAKAGLWILAALGLKSLAEYFIDGLPRLLEHYYAGFTQAWKAGKDPVSDRFMHEQSFQVSVASSRIADGHVAITLLLLSAITAYLLRGKNMQALAKEARGGRLGDKFATWMVQNEDKLRKHPKLQPQQNNRSAGGTEGGLAGGSNQSPPKKTVSNKDDVTHVAKSELTGVTTFNDGIATWVKVAGDPKAVVRIESTAAGPNVTDIFKGSLPSGSGSDMLATGLKTVGVKSGEKFSFSGIINPETLASYKNGVPASDSLLGKVGNTALQKLGLEASSIEYQMVRGKLSVVIGVK